MIEKLKLVSLEIEFGLVEDRLHRDYDFMSLI